MAEQSDPQNPTWPELLGSNNWEGLLHPLDLSLRKLILRSGDLIQATYDAFNNDANSRFYGSSRYGKTSFFHKVQFDAADNFSVAAFLYATARVSVSEAFFLRSMSWEAWIGYIAISFDAAAAARSTSSGGETPGITSGSMSWAQNPTPLRLCYHLKPYKNFKSAMEIIVSDDDEEDGGWIWRA